MVKWTAVIFPTSRIAPMMKSRLPNVTQMNSFSVTTILVSRSSSSVMVLLTVWMAVMKTNVPVCQLAKITRENAKMAENVFLKHIGKSFLNFDDLS